MSTTSAHEVLLASAVNFLLDGGDNDAASLLLACSIEGWHHHWYVGNTESVVLEIRGPRMACAVLSDRSHPLYGPIVAAIDAVLPHGTEVGEVDVRAELVNLDKEWRDELISIARGKSVDNNRGPITWQNLRFASPPEVRIAQALDAAGVMFFPSSKGRLDGPDGRENRIPDFLVCKYGRWGILEVDGERWHPPSRTIDDHARDELFHQHGVRVVRHYDARECTETPRSVVARFLALLDGHYE